MLISGFYQLCFFFSTVPLNTDKRLRSGPSMLPCSVGGCVLCTPVWCARSTVGPTPQVLGRQQPLPPPPFRPTEGQNEQWQEANRRRQRQTIRYRGLVPTPPPGLRPTCISTKHHGGTTPAAACSATNAAGRRGAHLLVIFFFCLCGGRTGDSRVAIGRTTTALRRPKTKFTSDGFHGTYRQVVQVPTGAISATQRLGLRPPHNNLRLYSFNYTVSSSASPVFYYFEHTHDTHTHTL